MAVGAFSPAVGYLAKKAADRMTTGAMDRLGDLARVGGNASALQAPLNAVQSAARSGLAGQRGNHEHGNSLVAWASRARFARGLLAELLTKYNPPADGEGMGAAFAYESDGRSSCTVSCGCDAVRQASRLDRRRRLKLFAVRSR